MEKVGDSPRWAGVITTTPEAGDSVGQDTRGPMNQIYGVMMTGTGSRQG